MINLRNYKTVIERRKTLEKELKIKLPNIGHFSVDEKVASSRNCENMIGVTQVPLGIAGPLKINEYQVSSIKYQDFFIPLATTEGALVASVNRGCKAIFESGGVNVEIEKVGATRGPVFKVENIFEGQKLAKYLANNFTKKLKNTAEKTSHHLTLKKYDLAGVGKYRYVRFYFDTQEAMGLNMVTIATEAIVGLIEKDLHIECVSLSGNFCVDKKPSWQNFINQRGMSVKAEIVLSHQVLKDILKTDAASFYETWLSKCMLGSIMSGSMGFNAQYANIIAAIFIATGQDPAHVVEGSLGVTTTEMVSSKKRVDSSKFIVHSLEKEEDLYVSVYLPSLMIGVVGGGTNLATQKEALKILGIERENVILLGKIIAGAVLAGEISLLASLSKGSLAKAHQRLGRGSINF